jgi:hypothetical protein
VFPLYLPDVILTETPGISETPEEAVLNFDNHA